MIQFSIVTVRTSTRPIISCLLMSLLFNILFFVVAPIVHAAPEDWAVNVRGATLIDAKTGKILFEQRAGHQIAPASLTKVVSMFVALDAVKAGKKKLNTKVKISKTAAKQGGSSMNLKAGEYVTLNRLLYGMAISSGNDAAYAVAEHVGGSHKNFVKLMNQKVKKLGAKNTVFYNAHGLPAKGQLTTARDMARIAAAYLKTHPSSLKYHRGKTLTHHGVRTTNKNPLLKDFPGADGLKTGFVNASGYNIIATVKRGNTRLIGVNLGAVNSKIRSKEINRLMKAGFEAPKKKLTVTQYLLNPNQKPTKTAIANKTTTTKKQTASVSKKPTKTIQKSSGSTKQPSKVSTKTVASQDGEWTSFGSL